MVNNNWTVDEIELLESKKYTVKELSRLTNRTNDAIRLKASSLGIKIKRERKCDQYIGSVIYRWKLLKFLRRNKYGEQLYLCECQCKNKTIREVRGSAIITGKSKSCGCISSEMASKRMLDFNKRVTKGDASRKKPTAEDVTGIIYSKNLKALKFCYYKKHSGSYWLFLCMKCGVEKILRLPDVKRGSISSCGCAYKESNSLTASYISINSIKKKYNYNGIKMRSSFEVMVASILDQNYIQWQYEPKVFKLVDGCRYIPDFYLPEFNIWVEVKGWMRLRAQEKVNKFQELGYHLLIINQHNIEEVVGEKYTSWYPKIKEKYGLQCA